MRIALHESMSGVLALVGGDELNPGNEEQDRILAAAAAPGPAYVVATAAARSHPELAVAHAKKWFTQFGVEIQELPVSKRVDADSRERAEMARGGALFYIVGGDPGLVAEVLHGSRVWRAMFEAWLDGASLAGSSAGAMALCSHTLIRARFPDHAGRRPVQALGLVPDTAVLPHYDTFGRGWIESARRELPGVTLLGIDGRSAAVWQNDSWHAAGPGAVTMIRGSKVERFTSGMTISGLEKPIRMLPAT